MEQWKVKAAVEDGTGHAKSHVLHSGSPHTKAMDHWTSSHLSAIPEPDDTVPRSRSPAADNKRKDQVARTMLRLDAFLGEWLSPDYFDNITPPPGSKMMVAGAKADLLRRGDPVDMTYQANNLNKTQGHFPGGWKSNKVSSDESEKPTSSALGSMAELRQSLPKLTRANSHSVISTTKSINRHFASPIDQGQSTKSTGYSPPTPSYAVSPSQPIPQGYVAHARDACIKVDYQWDSMRSPLDWGNGGEYGEEWSAMHKRFRRGLLDMISWYRNHDPSEEADDKLNDMEELSHARTGSSDASDEDEIDTVLILVTHGAGCNALIGALTNQPVLIDVGMASLTMAVRKNVDYRRIPHEHSWSASPARMRRRSSIDSGISKEYDVKLTASTDHLRPGPQRLDAPPPRLRSPSLPVREKSPYRYERHVGTTAHRNTSSPIRDTFPRIPPKDDEDLFSENSSFIVESPTTSIGFNGGLWSPVSQQQQSKPSAPDKATNDATHEEAKQPRPESVHIDHPTPGSKGAISINGNGTAIANGHGNGKTLTHQGLWGTEPRALGTERDQSMLKRRWTSTHA